MPVEITLSQVFSVLKGAWPLLKTPLERTQWYQETLKKLGIPDPEDPAPDFKVVYAIALVKYGSEQEDKAAWDLANRLLKEQEIVTAFREAFSQGNYDLLLDAAEKCITELAVGDAIRETGLDYQQVLYEFTEQFLLVAQRSQTPAQSLFSLQSKVQHRQSQQTIAGLRQEIQRLAETVTKALPASKTNDELEESSLVKQMRSKSEIFRDLHDRGIGVQVHYIPVHTQPYYQNLGFNWGDYPIV
jgi:DegT/DnrJ/EryC1/StrS aminotransferase family